MKSLPYLVVLALLTSACQIPDLKLSSEAPYTVNQAKEEAIAVVKSPVLIPAKFKPEAKLLIQGNQVKLEVKFPAIGEYQTQSDFKTQLLDLSSALKIRATVKDSSGKTYSPNGATAGLVDYPASGVIALSFNAVIPDKLLFIELQVTDGAADIPQVDLATVVTHAGTADINTTINFQTTASAKVMKALLADDPARAKVIDLAALSSKLTEVTVPVGTGTSTTYTTHPSLVDVAAMATQLKTVLPGSLVAAAYRMVGATVSLSVNGLVGSDKIQVQVTDAASAIKTNLGLGSNTITQATPGAGLKLKVGAEATNSTQYSFSVAPTNLPTLVNNTATSTITITATPATVSTSSLSPSLGLIGSTLTINGSGFSTTAANNTVKFGSTDVAAASVNGTGTQLTVVVPPNLSGSQNVRVQVGALTSTPGLTFNVKPTVDAFITALPVGATLTLNGTGFSTIAANNTITIGGQTVSATSTSATSLTALLPNVPGPANVTVTVGGQTSDVQTVKVIPGHSGLSPVTGIVGSSILLTGDGFSSTAAANIIAFNSVEVPGSVTAVNGARTQLTVTVPNQFGSQNVTVRVGDQTSVVHSFAIKPDISLLQISGVTTSLGSVGDTLEISGSGFHTTAASNTVTVGSTSITPTLAGGKLQVVLPTSLAAGPANVTVGVDGQTSAPVTFAIRPKITALSTTAGLSGGKTALIRGEILTLTGSGFDTTTPANNTVTFTLSDLSTVTATAATANATSLTVTIPYGVEVLGDVSVTVTTATQISNSLTATLPSVSLNISNGGLY